ncbi:MAG: ROK family protein [Maricaulaceae bacterium]
MRLGVDIGGTKLETAFLGPDGAILARVRRPTPPDYDSLVRAVADLVAECEREAGAPLGAARIGVAHPGSISPATGLIRNSNSTWLNGRPLDRDLATAFGRPVRLSNDADCFALSEAVDGAGAGAEIVFGVILGTGVGGGVAVGGKLLDGAQAIAGEWGHTPLPWLQPDEFPGPTCWCGKAGCIETFLCGPALSASYEAICGAKVDGQELAARAHAGEPAARTALELYVHRLARALAGVINLLDPNVIVLGGGVSNIAGLAEAVQAQLGEHVFSDVVRTRVVKNRHGDSSGVRGAAWLWHAGDADE